MNWRLELSPEDKDAYTFSFAYAKVRARYQNGYKLFKAEGPEILQSRRFKTARTVAKWFSKSWSVTRKQPNLEGYIEYCFRRMEPTVPHLGQLRNEKLIREFIAAAPDVEVLGGLTDEELINRYKRALDPVLRHTQIISRLGLI